jgi:hypothetical protein
MPLLAHKRSPKHACMHACMCTQVRSIADDRRRVARMSIRQHARPLDPLICVSADDISRSSHQPKHPTTVHAAAVCCCWLHNPASGKTRCINHFLINNSWYLVDLPGYG